jgi:two-component system chemotaxis sensor kinase CheA
MDLTEQLGVMFREEAAEHLADLENALLALEGRPEDAELVAQAFRALHTLKGSSAMAGFEAVGNFTHALESVFVDLRSGALPVTPELIRHALAAKDHIRGLIEDSSLATSEAHATLLAVFRSYEESGESPAAAPASPSAPSAVPAHAEDVDGRLVRVRFRPHVDLFRDGSNPMGLLRELTSLGAGGLVCHTEGVAALVEMDPENCYVWWQALLVTNKDDNAVRDVFIFVEGHCEIDIEQVLDVAGSGMSAKIPALLQRLLESPDLTTAALRATLSEAVAPTTTAAAAAVSATATASAANLLSGPKPSEGKSSSIRVAADKLDSLVDLVGELVIAQARLAQIATTRDDAQIVSIAEDIGRLTSELRDNTLNIRMVPIGTTFGRFKRLVHDLSGTLGKDIDLVTEGAETELDKTVIERLADPLVHIIRNSCDHGIESPSQRRAAGKPERGTVRLLAYHSGPHVFIEIRDDGAGLDAAVIRNKAVSQGLLAPEAQLPDSEVWKLIFLPGFSTATVVSDVSGRGVGMDVVRRSIEALRGSVHIESAHGRGTTIRLRLPLTLAIIEGLLVNVGDASYVLPMSLVEECVELTRRDIEESHGNRMAAVRGELVPYLRLRDWFGVAGAPPDIEQIAIASLEGQRIGLVVDSVVGQHQTVIKTLGTMYQDVRGLSGATILGDGTLALIVDVPSLVHEAGGTHAAA